MIIRYYKSDVFLIKIDAKYHFINMLYHFNDIFVLTLQTKNESKIKNTFESDCKSNQFFANINN